MSKIPRKDLASPDKTHASSVVLDAAVRRLAMRSAQRF